MIPAKYSYRWADGIVVRLEEKYPRASEISYRLLTMTHRNAVAFLATGDRAFVELRNLIHFIDGCAAGHPDYYTDAELIEKIRLYWRSACRARFMERLDKYKIQPTLEEQESRGGG